jgi:alpha-methylacyl-CoA racemase
MTSEIKKGPTGPLFGLRIIEIGSIGPGPFGAMMLADHGAEVIRIDRPGGIQGGVKLDYSTDILARSRRSMIVDIKSEHGVAVLKDLIKTADGIMEGFRPGVMERLGLGPDDLRRINPKLVYGRITGWGQTGPLAQTAGHDINYIALSGALNLFGRQGDRPTPPLNLLGDFAGGGLMLAFGMVSALLEAQRSGQGQVVDCAMTEGATLLSSFIWTLQQQGNWTAERGTNELDTGAHYYDVYECADGKHIAVGAIEPKFYQELLKHLELNDDPEFKTHTDPQYWPNLKSKLQALILSKRQQEWCDIFEGSDACVTPVLDLQASIDHPHMLARQAYTRVGEMQQPAPAPKFSRTQSANPIPPRLAGADTRELLRELGYSAQEIENSIRSGAIGDAQ